MGFLQLSDNEVVTVCVATLFSLGNLNTNIAPFETRDLSGQHRAAASYGHTTTEPGYYGIKWAEMGAGARGPLLDIGSSWYGVTTIPALKTGATVIANDQDADSLRALQVMIPPELRPNVLLLHKEFPDLEPEIAPNSLEAVFLGSVLHFFSGPKIIEVLKAVYKWLLPGGRVVVETQTPYMPALAPFLPLYRANSRNGHWFPASGVDLGAYIPSRAGMKTTLLTPTELTLAFREAGFRVQEVSYFVRPEYPAGLAANLNYRNLGLRLRGGKSYKTKQPSESVGGIGVKPGGTE